MLLNLTKTNITLADPILGIDPPFLHSAQKKNEIKLDLAKKNLDVAQVAVRRPVISERRAVQRLCRRCRRRRRGP